MQLARPRKNLGLVDRAVIGTLLFLVLLLIGVQIAKAAEPRRAAATRATAAATAQVMVATSGR